MAEELFHTFKAAKSAYLAHLSTGKNLSPVDETVLGVGRVVGDPFPFGIDANRKTLDTVIQFAVQQQVIPKNVSPEDLFVPSTLTLA